MFCSKSLKVWELAVALFILIPFPGGVARSQQVNQIQPNTTVNLRWGPRPSVGRYRLQLAQDRNFADIVFDRVITGTQTQISDLAPGRYFWRVAPLTAKLGEFSSAGVVDVLASPKPSRTQTPIATTASNPPKNSTVNPIVAGGGWRAAIGEANDPVLAHLRSIDRWSVVTTSSDGMTYALDASNGVALWLVRNARPPSGEKTFVDGAPIVVPGRARLDDIVVASGSSLVRYEGPTGREIWRASLPAFSSSIVSIREQTRVDIVVIDTSLQWLFILNSSNGAITSQIKLPSHVIGKPMFLDQPSRGDFALAYDNGLIEIRDRTGRLIRSGSASSPATTAPILVRGRNGDLILVGTRDGLTALTADKLQPLGRVALNNDQPNGALRPCDLDSNGVAEVMMTTMRGHVVAVNAEDGKILWDVAARNDTSNFAFADLNRDGVFDVFTADGQIVEALSGRDGSLLWKESEPSSAAANHTTAFSNRALTAVSLGSNALIIISEPGRGGLRSLNFSNTGVRPAGH